MANETVADWLTALESARANATATNSSEALSASFLDKAWESSFTAHTGLQRASTGQIEGTWRVAGRATKANPDKENGIWWNASGREMLQRWVDWRTGGHGWKLWRTPQGQPAIELGITVNFGSVPVKMHIDRVFELPTGDLCILDLKTGSRTPSSDLQLAFYAVGMELALGVRPKFGTYWMAREGNTSALTDLGFYTAEMLTEMVEQFDKARKASIFVPNSNHCKLCDLTAHCKYYNNKEVTK